MAQGLFVSHNSTINIMHTCCIWCLLYHSWVIKVSRWSTTLDIWKLIRVEEDLREIFQLNLILVSLLEG